MTYKSSAPHTDTYRAIDYAPLASPVTRPERLAYIRQHHTGRNIVFIVTMFIVVGFIMASRLGPESIQYIIGLLAAILVFAVAEIYRDSLSTIRLQRFAAKNNMAYTPGPDTPEKPEVGLLSTGDRHRVQQQFTYSLDGRTVQIANYTFGIQKRSYLFTYAKVELPKQLPHILLDARRNNNFGMSNLPITWQSGQRLSLEGDFDKYYSLYCPKGYEADALYIFTPDFMSFLMDNAAEYDIEIIDNYLYLYRSEHTRWTEQSIRQIIGISDLVADQLINHSEAYGDYRVGLKGAGAISPAGTRLRTFNTAALSIGVGILAYAAIFFARLLIR